MKKTTNLLLFLIVSWFGMPVFSQIETNSASYLEQEAFFGYLIEHDKKLETAIQGNPFGLILSYNFKKIIAKDWAKYYNYPDFGFSALYQNTNSTVLGEMYGLYAHYNFYLNNRNATNKLQLRIAFGLGYNTTPFNSSTNQNNLAIGSKINGSAYLKLNYQRPFLKNKFGFNTGIALIHFSNAGIKSPNLGLNNIAATVGFNYNLTNEVVFKNSIKTPKTKGKINYSIIARSGINESLIINSGQFAFYNASFIASKQTSFKSTLTTGLDYFYANFLALYIDEDDLSQATITNKNRVGLTIGHELKINKLLMVSQIGYHVYYPKKYISRIYERFGFKYYLNNTIFTELTLKINLFRAEALEFGLGIKL